MCLSHFMLRNWHYKFGGLFSGAIYNKGEFKECTVSFNGRGSTVNRALGGSTYPS